MFVDKVMECLGRWRWGDRVEDKKDKMGIARKLSQYGHTPW